MFLRRIKGELFILKYKNTHSWQVMLATFGSPKECRIVKKFVNISLLVSHFS